MGPSKCPSNFGWESTGKKVVRVKVDFPESSKLASLIKVLGYRSQINFNAISELNLVDLSNRISISDWFDSIFFSIFTSVGRRVFRVAGLCGLSWGQLEAGPKFFCMTSGNKVKAMCSKNLGQKLFVPTFWPGESLFFVLTWKKIVCFLLWRKICLFSRGLFQRLWVLI